MVKRIKVRNMEEKIDTMKYVPYHAVIKENKQKLKLKAKS